MLQALSNFNLTQYFIIEEVPFQVKAVERNSFQNETNEKQKVPAKEN
jgi:hypothetical protein